MSNTAPESPVPRASSAEPGGRLRRPGGIGGRARAAVRVFFVGGVISYRGLFNWISPGIYVTTMLGSPLFQILFFTYLGRYTNSGNDDFYIVGNAVQVAASCPSPSASRRSPGGSGATSGLAAALGRDASEVPESLVAVTLKV